MQRNVLCDCSLPRRVAVPGVAKLQISKVFFSSTVVEAKKFKYNALLTVVRVEKV